MADSNFIHLLGNPEENFYALGLRDKQNFDQMARVISRLCLRSEALSASFKKAMEISRNFTPRGSIDLRKQLEAYAQGLDRPVSDVYFNLLMPEVVAAFNRWAPNLIGIIPGCSSLFYLDPNNGGVVHARILDYAMAGIFEQHERAVLYDFSDRYKAFTYSSVGMPFPSLSAMNEKGLTLALHYKHADYFDLSGDSIFSIAYQIISFCSTVHEVKKYLKGHPSISYWGIYVSDSKGNVGSFDICGNEIYQEKFDLKEHPYLYFNNRPLLVESKHQQLQPFGNLEQCKMRHESTLKQMNKVDLPKAKQPDLEILSALCFPTLSSKQPAKKFKLTAITPSTIQALTFHSGLMQSYFTPGASPKIFPEKFLHYQNLFKPRQLSCSEIENKITPVQHKFKLGYEHLARAQSEFDMDQMAAAYHHLQMAIEYFENHAMASICRFYFIVWQYLFTQKQKDFVYLYEDLCALDGLLPAYLEAHRQLFIMRLKKILGHKHTLPTTQFPGLNVYFEKEYKLRPTAIKLMRKLIIPRIEILDIIYLF